MAKEKRKSGGSNAKQKSKMAKGKTKGDGKAGTMATTTSTTSADIMDERFRAVNFNPKFAKKAKGSGKIKVDKRFQSMFTDEDFTGLSAKVDKYGRKLKKKDRNRGNDLKRFYDVDDENDAEEEEDEEEEKEMSKKKRSQKQQAKSKGPSAKMSRIDYLNKLARGEIEGESSSSEDDSDDSDDSDSDDDDDGDETEESKLMQEEKEEQEEEEEESIPTGDETYRFAIQNLDWSRMSAQDIYVVLQSFLPLEGTLKKVTVYQSIFGEERMKHEDMYGPQLGDVNVSTSNLEEQEEEKDGREDKQKGKGKKEDQDVDSSDEEDDDEEEEEEDNDDDDDENTDIRDIVEEGDLVEGNDFDMEKLRKYELDKLKYYFAVAEFDSKETAYKVYKECDGVEYDRTAVVFDLRFVPDDLEIDRPIRDVANKVSEDYECPEFYTRALQSTNVELTWDEDDYNQQKLNRWKDGSQVKGKRMICERDLEAFIASDVDSDSGSDSEDDEEGGASKTSRRRKLKQRNSLRAALLGETNENSDEEKDKDEEEEEEDNDDEDGDLEMQVFQETENEDELPQNFTGSEDNESNPKVKKKKKNNQMNSKKALKDSFFKNPEAPFSKRKRQRNARDDDDDDGEYGINESNRSMSEKDRLEKEQAELELLLLDEKSRKKGSGLEGFDFKMLAAGEKLLNKGKRIKAKGKKRQKVEEALEAAKQDTFKVDTKDDRFASFYQDPDFSVDRTSSQYQGTRGMRDLEQEQLKQRGKAKAERAKEEGFQDKANDSSDVNSIVEKVKLKLSNGVGKKKKKSKFDEKEATENEEKQKKKEKKREKKAKKEKKNKKKKKKKVVK